MNLPIDSLSTFYALAHLGQAIGWIAVTGVLIYMLAIPVLFALEWYLKG